MNKIIMLFIISLAGTTVGFSQLYVKGLLHVQDGAELHVQNDIEITTGNGKLGNAGLVEVEGDWTIDGMAEYAGTGAMGNRKVVFKNDQFNTTSDQIITGDMTGANAFYDIEINNTGTNGLVEMNGNIQVASELVFVNGKLDMNANDILLDGQIMSETEMNRVTGGAGGEIIKTMMLNAPAGVNPGNIGAEFTSAANLGMTTVKRTHNPAMANSNQGIMRVFDISPSNNSGLNATLKFHYFDAEINGIPESELELWRNDGSGWTNEGITSRDGTNDILELTGIDAFSEWTATNLANALPVELVFFNAEIFEKNQTLLTWATASEINNQGFSIERSFDTNIWEELAFIDGNGNSNGLINYQFIDENPRSGLNYYRLKQIDFDGTLEVSDVVTVSFSDDLIVGEIFPNPSELSDNFHIKINPPNESELRLFIFDRIGKLIESNQISLAENENLVQINQSRLPPGIYFVKLEMENKLFYRKILKQ